MKHSNFSPSSSHRWLRCPGSIQLSWGSEDQPTGFAQEGIQAHELAEICLRKNLDPLDPFLGNFPEEMRIHVQSYVDFVRNESFGKKLIVEEILNLAPLVPEVYGTADVVIISENQIHVIDLKYGVGEKVSALGNEQLKIYALGAWLRFKDQFQKKRPKFKWSIFQPRLDHLDFEECSLEDLLIFSEKVSTKVSEALAETPNLIPGEIQCRWCPARGSCAARAKKNIELAKKEFQDSNNLDFLESWTLTNEILSKILPWLPEMKKWISDVETEALNRLKKGQGIEGYKLIRGRASRKWKADAIENLSHDSRFFETRLKTFTELKKVFGRDLDGILEKYTFKPEGNLKLVSDNTPGEKKLRPQNEFTKIEEKNEFQ